MADRQAKILESMKESIASGDFYEAHQRTRTIVSRNMMKKQFDAAYKLISEVVSSLIDHGHLKSASDLALFYIEVLKKSNITATQLGTDEKIDEIANLLDAFEISNVELNKFTGQILELTQSDEEPYGNQTLRYLIGNHYFSNKSYENAMKHFVHSESGKEVGDSLALLYIEIGNEKSESSLSKFDQKMISTVFECLALGKYINAIQAIKFMGKKAEKQEGFMGFCDSTDMSINFLKFLSESIQNNDFNSYKTVTQNYEQLYQDIENHQAYLEKICQKNFGKSLKDPRESKQSSYQGSPNKKGNNHANKSSAMPDMSGVGGLGANMADLLGNINMDDISSMMGGAPSAGGSGGAQSNASPFGGMDMGAMAGMAQQMMANNPNFMNDIGAMFGGPEKAKTEKPKPSQSQQQAPPAAENPFGGMDMGAMAGMAQQMMASNPNLLNDLGAMFGGGTPGGNSGSQGAPDMSNLMGMAQNMMGNNPDLMSQMSGMFGGNSAAPSASAASNADTSAGNTTRQMPKGMKNIPKDAKGVDIDGMDDDDID